MAAYDKAAADFRTRHAASLRNARVGILAYYDPELSLVHDPVKLLPPQVFTDLGGQLATIKGRSGTDKVSLENLDLLDDLDAIFLLAPKADIGGLDSNKLWRRVPAVSRSRVVVADERTYYGSIYSATELVTQFDKLFSTLT
ncbi:hypothetical protein SAMN05421505_110128 [Sinosporangium album]|uniref:Iron complex transport system substrate-binding protein n=2 Tax=Sinosporangium album TaxID=504805 RepID=A0A1G7Z069_9ACTN|nr:hypothetical protein SAMN05421505_110128 [Sinosporangium album]